MKQVFSSAILAIVLFIGAIANSADKVIVIPMNSAGEGLKNVVTVSAKGGDFTDPVAAMNSISDASETNPYLVFIGPGLYELSETLVMKPFVTVAGSGQEVTTLSATISGATVSGEDNAMLRDLTVKHDANGTGSSNAINLQVKDFTVHNVTVEASGGTHNTGIYNSEGNLTLVNVTVSVTGGAEARGISNGIGATTLENVVVSASGGTDKNYGISNTWSKVTIKNSTISATGGTDSYGIKNSYYNKLIMKNSSISVSDATGSNIGVSHSESTSTLTNVEIAAAKGQNTFGVDVGADSSATLTDVIISATQGSVANYGVRNSAYGNIILVGANAKAANGTSSYGIHTGGDTSNSTIRRSIVQGGTGGLFCDALGIATVSQTTIIGGGGGGTGTRTCVASDDGNGSPLGSTCL